MCDHHARAVKGSCATIIWCLRPFLQGVFHMNDVVGRPPTYKSGFRSISPYFIVNRNHSRVRPFFLICAGDMYCNTSRGIASCVANQSLSEYGRMLMSILCAYGICARVVSSLCDASFVVMMRRCSNKNVVGNKDAPQSRVCDVRCDLFDYICAMLRLVVANSWHVAFAISWRGLSDLLHSSRCAAYVFTLAPAQNWQNLL